MLAKKTLSSYIKYANFEVQGGSNMTGTDVTRFTHKQSRSYLNHLVGFAASVSMHETKSRNAESISMELYIGEF